jgi:LysR family cyn operon transcriptional activator
MDVRTLRYCQAIARLGSFTKAAAALHVAQPALSVAIKGLENELGVALFVRQARRVSVTAEGAMLLQRAERIFEEIDTARSELQDAVGLRIGEVRVGMPPMYGLEYFPKLIADFHAAYSGLTMAVTSGSADEIARLLDAGEIDLAMLESRRIRRDWRHVAVGREEMVLCVAKNHTLAKRQSVSGRDLDKLPMVLFDRSFIQREILDKICQRAKAKPTVVLQSNSVPLIRQVVVSGLGAATLLRSLANAKPPLVALSFDPPQVLRFSLCWRGESYLSKANRAFIEFAQKFGLPK